MSDETIDHMHNQIEWCRRLAKTTTDRRRRRRFAISRTRLQRMWRTSSLVGVSGSERSWAVGPLPTHTDTPLARPARSRRTSAIGGKRS